MQNIHKQQNLLELYAKIQKARYAGLQEEVKKSGIIELQKWFNFYNDILDHNEISSLNCKKDVPNWMIFSANFAKDKIQLEQSVGVFIASSLSSTEQVLEEIWKTHGFLLNQLVDWTIAWIDSECSISCNCKSCHLWEICKNVANPISNWMHVIENYLIQKGNQKPEEVKKQEIEEIEIWKKFFDYCLTSSNFLHVIIIANILKSIPSASLNFDFVLVERKAKFDLLILSNLKGHENLMPHYSIGSKMSIFEYLAKWQLSAEDKSPNKHILIEKAHLYVKKYLENDKLSMNLNMEDKYLQFQDYINELQFQEDYFYSGLSKSQVGAATDAQEIARKAYKDPIFLLSKLTENPNTVKDFLTCRRLWEHAFQWEKEGTSFLEEFDGIFNEYVYIENFPLRTAVFINVWKQYFAKDLLKIIQSQQTMGTMQLKSTVQSADTLKRYFNKLLDLILTFRADIKETKHCIKQASAKEKMYNMEGTDDPFLLSIINNNFGLCFNRPFDSKKVVSTNIKDLTCLYNMLYDEKIQEVYAILKEETQKCWKYSCEKNLEKEYVLAPKDATNTLKAEEKKENDTFYKQSNMIVELVIRILLAQLQMGDQKSGKQSEAKKKGKHSKKFILSEMLNLKENELVDTISFRGNNMGDILSKIYSPKTEAIQLRISVKLLLLILLVFC